MRSFLACLAFLLASGVSAQGRLAFDTERHDFGTFDEGETVTHAFRFTNVGDAPLSLTEVESSCGCTTPEWTRDAVAPGASGTVVVAFDSEGRPGPFEKLITVSASGVTPVSLRIVGDVTSVFVARGVKVGGLTFATDRLDVGEIGSGEPVQVAFRFQHTGDRPIRIVSVNAPDGVDVVFPDGPMFSGDVRALMVTVDAPDALALGGVLDLELSVETSDTDMPVKTLHLRATIAESSSR